MKKTIFIIFLAVLLCGSAAAEPRFETAEELYNSWVSKNNYPSYVCSVVSDGLGNLTIGVTDNEDGRAGADEILDLIEDDSTVSFIYQKYTYNELKEAQEEIFAILDTNNISSGWESGIDQQENQVYVVIEDTYKDFADNLTALCAEKYGDMVSVTITKDKLIAIDDYGEKESETVPKTGALVIIPALLVIAAAVLLIKKRTKR